MGVRTEFLKIISLHLFCFWALSIVLFFLNTTFRRLDCVSVYSNNSSWRWRQNPAPRRSVLHTHKKKTMPNAQRRNHKFYILLFMVSVHLNVSQQLVPPLRTLVAVPTCRIYNASCTPFMLFVDCFGRADVWWVSLSRACMPSPVFREFFNMTRISMDFKESRVL
jgi:hypothetical protein